MFSKLTCLISVALVVGLALTRAADAQEPGLVGLWKLDSNANDSSGNNNRGTLAGNPQWMEGQIGGALSFDGSDDHVDCGNDQSLDITGPITIAAWFYPTGRGSSDYPRIVDKSNGSGGADPGYKLYLRAAQNYVFTLSAGGVYQPNSTLAANLNTWNYVAFIAGGTQRKLFLNGAWEEWNETTLPNSSSNPLFIGNSPAGARHFLGMIDEVRVYNRALTAEEVLKAMRGPLPPTIASEPVPDEGATDVARDVTLRWNPGVYAAPVNGHTVYLSENFHDVNEGVGGISQSGVSYTPHQLLDFATKYYWRVDEVNAPPSSAVYEGEVWSFTTEPAAYQIENVIATASSNDSGKGPENTVNGSGLDDDGLHSMEETDMWLSGVELIAAWIQFEFEKVYALDPMLVWNHNSRLESVIGFGIKEVTIEYSVDGADWIALGTTHEFAPAPGQDGYSHNTTVDFGGVAAKYVRLTTSSNFKGLAKQYGLSEVRFFYTPLRARGPHPESGATDVDPDLTLSWRAGRRAAQHDLYISSDEQSVIDGTAPLTTITEASHTPLALDLGTTYYWRVNEVNMAETSIMLEGDVWNFTTPEFIVVDDFEGYGDYPPDEIFNAWIDGWGIPEDGGLAANDVPPFAETTTVYSGSQAMPFRYDNTGAATYSEAERTFATAQDWTKYGLKTLSLRFYGNSDNVAGKMYVKVNGAKVEYDGDASDLARAGWQAWNVELASFGVAMQSVTTLAIGVDGAGAGGTLFIDDIRLFAYERRIVTPTEPDTVGLVAHYKLDQNANDSSGNNNHGTLAGNPQWLTGKMGGAVDLDGRNDYIDCGNAPSLNVTGPITISAWIYPVGSGLSTYPRIVDKSNGTGAADPGFKMYPRSAENYVVTLSAGGASRYSSSSVVLNSWNYVAFAITGTQWKFLMNGVWDEWEESALPSLSTNPLFIGNSPVGDRHFDGLIDDVRIYSRALTTAEIAWLAGETEPFEEPF